MRILHQCRGLIYQAQRKHSEYWNILKKLFKNNPKLTILDIGAYNGSSIHNFKKPFPESIIHSFEPTIALHKELEAVCKKYNNVFLHKCALSNCTGKALLYTTPFAPTNSLHPQNLKLYELYNARKKEFLDVTPQEINTLKLDDWVKEYNIKTIDILKTDTQAHDFAVLEGGKITIPNIVKLVISEVHFDRFYENGKLFFDVCRLMYEYGFKIVDFFAPHYYSKKVLIECDALFYNPKFIPLSVFKL